MTPTNGTEDRLQQTLRNQADRMAGLTGTPFEQVRHQAGRIRRRRRITVATVVAAVVVAITVPTAVLLQGEPSAVHPPATHTTPSPTPTQTPPPTPTKSPSDVATPPRSLASIPRGASTFLSYVDADGIVHSDGSTSRLPGTMDPSTQFLSYRGGWLVGGGIDNTLREYDSTGKVVASGRYGGMVLTADRTNAAWIMDGKLYQSALNTMGEAGAAQPTPVPASSEIVGFLPEGLVLTAGDDAVRIVGGTTTQTVQMGMLATTTSQSADLAGGLTGTVAQGNLEGAVFDMNSHTQLWHNSWRPLRFSDDGTLVAAAPAFDNGDPSVIAILDARTGKVVARTPKLSGIYLGWDIAWDQHRLIIPSTGGKGEQAALLALDTAGNLTRASDVAQSSKPGGAYLIFDAQP